MHFNKIQWWKNNSIQNFESDSVGVNLFFFLYETIVDKNITLAASPWTNITFLGLVILINCMIPLASAWAEKDMYSTLILIWTLRPFTSIFRSPCNRRWPTVPATQYPGIIITLASSWHLNSNFRNYIGRDKYQKTGQFGLSPLTRNHSEKIGSGLKTLKWGVKNYLLTTIFSGKRALRLLSGVSYQL